MADSSTVTFFVGSQKIRLVFKERLRVTSDEIATSFRVWLCINYDKVPFANLRSLLSSPEEELLFSGQRNEDCGGVSLKWYSINIWYRGSLARQASANYLVVMVTQLPWQPKWNLNNSFVFSCIESIFDMKVPLHDRHQPTTLLLW